MKKGFTLMELLVYMAIVGIIVVVAGQAFTNSTKFRVRTQNMLDAAQVAENAAMNFKADVSQMGAKSSREQGDAVGGASYGDLFSEVYKDVYMDPDNPTVTSRDSSSFELITTDNGSDSLFIRYVRYDDDGHYAAVEESHWYVEGDILKRACRMVAGDKEHSFCSEEDREEAKKNAVNIATGVREFKVIPARPHTILNDTILLFPPNAKDLEDTANLRFRLAPRKGDGFVNLGVSNTLGEIGAAGTGQKLGGALGPFFSNFNNDTEELFETDQRKVNQVIAIGNVNADPEDNWSNLCRSQSGNYGGHLHLEKNTEYELSFSMPLPSSASDRSLLFVPGKDHMSVGFRNFFTGNPPKKGTIQLIDDFMFFPPLDVNRGDGRRTMRFTVSENIDSVCIAFTFACYSPLVSQGMLTIDSLILRKLPYMDADRFEDVYIPQIADKKNIKALMLKLTVIKSGETGVDSLVIPIPSNGPRD